MRSGRAQILEPVRAEVADVSRRRARGSSATAAPGRRGRRLRCARPCARRGRRIPPRSAAARPCAAPSARGSARRPAPRWASAAAATASDARANATKNASPCVSTSTPSWLGKRRAESPPMLVQRLPVPVAELVQQPRRALDVREQQRHDTGREIAHHRTRSCADAPFAVQGTRDNGRERLYPPHNLLPGLTKSRDVLVARTSGEAINSVLWKSGTWPVSSDFLNGPGRSRTSARGSEVPGKGLL